MADLEIEVFFIVVVVWIVTESLGGTNIIDLTNNK